ncbi:MULTISPECIES: Zn-dependent hydrolase [unclassified Roseitalea]|uniref:Zn-dependent hydrolase n=1 Tax=unclassified Roseitalea TaxID=2639107 RepID=UPI00273D8B79|nr:MULTISPECIES: Zn-dependent hydrolase [unclassified Roseitalea]
MSENAPTIDPARLRALLDGVNRFGFNPETGGYNRIGFCDADTAVRAWFAERMRADGLAVHRDAVGNVIGRFGPAEGPCVMAGSHLDTVPEGGAFDGALGVCVALECVRALRDAGIAPQLAVEVVATAEEEGRFGGMLGSQAIAGIVDSAWFHAATDSDGVRLTDAMAEQGLEPERYGEAARTPDQVRAFIELHVEQGPLLEGAGTPVGIATAVSGVCNLEITLDGQANHSGTTPMAMRADAFAGLAEAAAAIEEIIAARGTAQSRVTIGKVALSPNFAHTIAGRAVFSVIVRDTDESVMCALRDSLLDRIHRAAGRHRLTVAVQQKSWIAPIALDPGLQDLLAEEGARLGIETLRMPSGAGHDAQTMQALCPSALVFVPSRGGISHAPAEWTDWADIEKGARIMLAALTRLTR